MNSVTLLVDFEALGRHCFCLLKHWRIETQCWIYMHKVSLLGLLRDCPLVPIYILNRSSPSPKAIPLLVSAQPPSRSTFFCIHTCPFSFPLPWALSFPTGSVANLIALQWQPLLPGAVISVCGMSGGDINLYWRQAHFQRRKWKLFWWLSPHW